MCIRDRCVEVKDEVISLLLTWDAYTFCLELWEYITITQCANAARGVDRVTWVWRWRTR